MHRLIPALLTAVCFTSPIAAQDTAAPSGPSTGAMVANGVFAGAIGIVGGALIGARMETCQDDYFCGLAGGLIGATVGSTIMIPLGIHLEDRRSPFLQKLAVSVLLGGVAVMTAKHTNGGSLLMMPLAQVIATIAVEHQAK